MNRKQKIVLAVGGLFLVISFLFPPYFGIDVNSNGKRHSFIGYYSVFNPPSAGQVYSILKIKYPSEISKVNLSNYQANINMVRLISVIVGILIITATGTILFRKKKIK